MLLRDLLEALQLDTGRLHGEVLPLLLGLARTDERPVVRRMAAHCLRQLAPDRPESARVLLEGSRDADVRVRRASLAAMVALIAVTGTTVRRVKPIWWTRSF